jgi:hypothetical protein
MRPDNRSAALTFFAGLLFVSFSAWPQGIPQTDAAHIERFQQTYKKVEPVPALDAYATVARYDAAFLGDNLKKALENVSNDQGGIAWCLASRMMSLNEMYRVTGDVKYLSANLECIRAVMAVRDDKRGVKLWTGIIAPAWGSDKYAQRGRAVFGVHTGMITYPMLDFLLLAKQHPDFLSKLGNEYQTILTSAEEALAYHDRQWRDGPGKGEGHYIMMDQENGSEGKPKPGNRLSALGRALWTSWKVTGNTTHRDRARAIGLYMKRRLTPAPDGAYYWPYWLPLEPVEELAARESISGEDTSHAGLTIALPILLASEGEVFDEADMKRLGSTVIRGFGRLGNGILLGEITGNPRADDPHNNDPHNAANSAGWLPLSKYAPAVRDRILAFYLNYAPSPSPLDLALILRYR